MVMSDLYLTYLDCQLVVQFGYSPEFETLQIPKDKIYEFKISEGYFKSLLKQTHRAKH